MRKLSATKAVFHALKSVWSFRAMAVRIVLFWAPVLMALGVIELYVGPPDLEAREISSPLVVQLLTSLVSLLAICSVAVGWHRFILRDDTARGVRLDKHVLLYAGNTMLILLAMFLPALITVIVGLIVPPAAALLGLAALALSGGAITRLSIKLPAVALGDSRFSFRDAWGASAGNYWPCVAVFLLNLVIAAGGLLGLVMLVSLFALLGEAAGSLALVAGGAVLQLFFAVFNASIFTSLYGFFVERRDF
ncbi:MAG: hypothetical protein ACKOED_09330 [Aestuariivirga sp.]|uniref:hypothetical protein n=1 Tax=Aestuariivirga sp. TaxID=2650926 RepID=UPI0038D04435